MNECVWKVEWDTLYKVKWHAWKSVVVSAICFAVVCWGTAGNIISARNASRINKLIHMTGTTTGQNFEAFVRDSMSQTALHQGAPSSPAPAHTTEVAELLLPQTNSSLLQEINPSVHSFHYPPVREQKHQSGTWFPTYFCILSVTV